MTLREAADGGTATGRLPARLSPSRLLYGLWYRRSVRLQLLVVFILIDFIAAIVAGGVTIALRGRGRRCQTAGRKHQSTEKRTTIGIVHDILPRFAGGIAPVCRGEIMQTYDLGMAAPREGEPCTARRVI